MSERWAFRGVLQHEGCSGLLTKFAFLREFFPNRIKESATVRAPVLLIYLAFLGFLYTGFCFVEMPATYSLTILLYEGPWKMANYRIYAMQIVIFPGFFPLLWNRTIISIRRYYVVNTKGHEAVFFIQFPAKSARHGRLKWVRLKKSDPTKIMHLIVHRVWVSLGHHFTARLIRKLGPRASLRVSVTLTYSRMHCFFTTAIKTRMTTYGVVSDASSCRYRVRSFGAKVQNQNSW